jgi:transposase
VSDVLDPAPFPEGVDIPAEDWQRTPLSMRVFVRTLLKRVAALETRLRQDSSNSSRPPSTDAPTTKRQRRRPAAERRKPGGKLGHPGHQPMLLEPTATVALFPEECSCGHAGFADLRPYHTHQVIELPVMRPDVPHWLLHQGNACPAASSAKRLSLPIRSVATVHG